MKTLSLSFLVTLLSVSVVSAAPVDFVRDVRPIFEAHCYSCHGEDKQKSGLRLDVKEAAFRGGSGHAPDIIPGKPDESPLIRLLRGEEGENLRMPLNADPLSSEEIATLSQWIAEGAVWPDGVDRAKLTNKRDYWSFKPVAEVEPPTPANAGWARSDIDRFVLAKLEATELSPSLETDRLTWLRRVTFDLTGLPPTPEEIATFLADNSETAFETVVDRLLDSPRYGERWAQHWLDVVRYADTHGFEVNTERKNAWPYRDYVIESFNDDVPWDQFIREQIAGDAYGKAEATGFLVTAAALLPGQIGKDDASKRLARQDELGEVLINTGEAFLGLSIGCARCHDHKFDPITARDYYSLQAFFAGVKYGDRAIENPELDALVADLQSRLSPLEKELSEIVLPAGKNHSRPPVSARGNIDRFPPVEATRLRFTIHTTIKDNFREPFLDELEIFNHEGRNIALDAKAVNVSGGRGKELLNNGVYGNDSCWRSDKKGSGWVEIEFDQPQVIDQVRWGRDRLGKFGDRLAEQYAIEIKNGAESWQLVADASDRAPFDPQRAKAELFQPETFAPEHRKRAAALVAKRKPLVDELQQYSGGQQLVFAATSNEPEPMHLLNRGDPEQPKDEVDPATPEFLQGVSLPRSADDLRRRQALADWIADPENPLTARVIVNRIWQWHFGMGLVETANDFGRAGTKPSHPELLDWLATEFIRSGWSVKKLHRLIVLSATYRQSHVIDPEAQAVDADTRLLWRFPSRRLEAEAIRDSMLAVSGRLNLKAGGRGFDLFRSRGGLSGFPPIESFEEEGRRRLIYAHKIRMEREIVFGAFDCPDAGQSLPRRRQSTTPIQALNLFNSQFTLDESEALADRARTEAGETTDAQVEAVYRLALGRAPDLSEKTDAAQVVEEHGLETLCRAVFNSNEFLFLP